MEFNTIKKMTVSGIFIALATVLSLITLIKMPYGGSVTPLSMLPICLIAIMYGTKWGFFCSGIYALIQLFIDLGSLMSWGLDVKMWIGSVIFDYLIAFTILGLSGIFRKKGIVGMCGGITLAIFLRFVSHFISGAIFFAIWMPEEFSSPYVYSLVYNGAYMIPELIFTVIGSVLILIIPIMKKEINANM